MNRLARLFLSLTTFALLTAPAVSAQTIGQVTFAEVIPGHQMEFLDGVREHMAWYTDAGGTWPVMTMEIVMGERTGQWVFWSPERSYADFDDPAMQVEGAEESFYSRIAPHMARAETSLLMYDDDLSMAPTDDVIEPIYEVLTFETAGPASDARMEAIMRRVKEAYAAIWPDGSYTVFRGAQGARMGTWIVVIPHESFASMAGESGGLEEMFETVVSEMEARQLVDMMEASLDRATSEVFVVRQDMMMNMN